ncbi:MAG: hypothetical protein IT269_07780, partial [Saprospiraceae bacterium]|nr:hypothetical protein [Saprospiraceae bacterium]
SHQFVVKDCSPPNLLCINGLTQQLEPPDCQVSFAASSFILSLTDNCTPNNQIQIGIRKAGSGTGFPTTDTMTYLKCDKGTNFVEIVARDASGLMNTCNSYVLVQDGDSDCVCNQDGDLDFRGCLRKGDGFKLNNFQLRTRVVSTSGVTPTVNKYRVTNYQDSCYSSITEKLPFGGNYLATVQAVKQDYPLNGVSTFDLVLISKHILGIESFTSAYQALAADVNRSSSVTTFDIVETRKLLLGIYDTFPAVPSWRVIRPLANPASLLSFSSTLDTYQIVLPNLQDDHVLPGLDFVAVKSGDVNFSADVSTLQPNDDDRSEVKPPLRLRFDRARLRAGEEALVAVSLGADVQTEGWQMSLGFDRSSLQCVGVVGLPAEQYRFTENGLLRLLDVLPAGQTLLAGTPLFFLKLRATHDTELSQSLFLDSALQPELYEEGAGRRMLELGKKNLNYPVSMATH